MHHSSEKMMYSAVLVIASLSLAAGLQTCLYNGKTYNSGQGFPSADGCNTCSCSSNGAVMCTLRFCLPKAANCQYNHQSYTSGASFKSTDGCNTCGCQDGMVFCTEMACLNTVETTKQPF